MKKKKHKKKRAHRCYRSSLTSPSLVASAGNPVFGPDRGQVSNVNYISATFDLPHAELILSLNRGFRAGLIGSANAAEQLLRLHDALHAFHRTDCTRTPASLKKIQAELLSRDISIWVTVLADTPELGL